MADPIAFPPMPEEVFLAKFARWLKRGPKVFKPANTYGRPSTKRIPKDKFLAHLLGQ